MQGASYLRNHGSLDNELNAKIVDQSVFSLSFKQESKLGEAEMSIDEFLRNIIRIPSSIMASQEAYSVKFFPWNARPGILVESSAISRQ